MSLQVQSLRVAALLVGIEMLTPPDVPFSDLPDAVALVMAVLYPSFPNVLISLDLFSASRWCSARLNISHGGSLFPDNSESMKRLALGPNCVQLAKITLPTSDLVWTPIWSRMYLCLARRGRL